MPKIQKLRIHPAIGIARVGNSEEYYIAPETSAGLPTSGQSVTGGLPIKPDTESTTITSKDLRDAQGRLKRQAARFRIVLYEENNSQFEKYPLRTVTGTGAGTEIKIGSPFNGRTVTDIVWTVHLANKKAICWRLEPLGKNGVAGLPAYANGNHPALRNANFGVPPQSHGQPPDSKKRLQHLVIDAGPRAIRAKQSVAFDKFTAASWGNPQTKDLIETLPNYPKSFPATESVNSISSNPTDISSTGSTPITTLGDMTTDTSGRLLVMGGYGRACGFDAQGQADPNAQLNEDVDNDNWFDDTSDGPVSAFLVLDDGTTHAVDSDAWVVSTDPAYAPQIRNVVTVWDEVFTTWVEQLGLVPSLYSANNVTKTERYDPNYTPRLPDEIYPILHAAALQRWNTNLPWNTPNGYMNGSHNFDSLNKDPSFTFSVLRNPSAPDSLADNSLMPLALGDNQVPFLALTTLQYFLMSQWAVGVYYKAPHRPLGVGEALDKVALENCLGGRFGPGIDLTFIVRDPLLYKDHWQDPSIGPFRINARSLKYDQAVKDAPFLTEGYMPANSARREIEPGDLSKFMAIPWHTDYNSCATHSPDPNPNQDPNFYWSWPAQRPVAVYTYHDVKNVQQPGYPPTVLPDYQHYSVRGLGTTTEDPSKVGRYQRRQSILVNWDRIGFVIQGPAIDKYDPEKCNPEWYVEVESRFEKDESNLVYPFPNQQISPPPK
ncbi:hypothetical protein WJ36_32840 [Burkholderia ubonensis]|uniref:LodA/GoxA family CTQ-dependent oxidase n=1 Tax=Burkholderia ubonensis TaxID=101571 RepID=UPI00075B97F6|nr:LodA/GoxA family CTQ-dependent oxidase [Burkholderia ubonensis]KVG87083.1 hypothetical protein WJ36_32840 [Burkholderia ubonensis]